MEGYKERCKAERDELGERMERLGAMLRDWRLGRLDFEPSCPMYLLERQYDAMSEYMRVLEARNYIEKMW